MHARFASGHSRRGDDVQRLLDEGIGADLDPRWNAIVAASVALTRTPVDFGPADIAALRSAGLDDTEIADVVHGAAFFNWANRLMLSIASRRLRQRSRGQQARVTLPPAARIRSSTVR